MIPDLFTPAQPLSDLIDRNPAILGIMVRTGLGFAIGQASVAEACQKYGVDAPTFLLICNIYTFREYAPSAEDLERADARTVLTYLRKSHDHYLGYALGSLATSIDRMLEPCDEQHRAVIRKFYADYKAELERHFRYEEKKVFPLLEASVQPDAKATPYRKIEDNHHRIDEKIEDLKNIVMKYLPKACDDALIACVLTNIYQLKYDLEQHTAVEDLMLIPMMDKLLGNGR